MIERTSDITIEGNGALLVVTKYVMAINIHDCARIGLTNMTFDYDPLPFTQGEVVKVVQQDQRLTVTLDGGNTYQTVVPSVLTQVFPDMLAAAEAGGVTLDPTKVSNDFFTSGTDVLMSGIDTNEVLVQAGQKARTGMKVTAVPYDFREACREAPEVCLGVPYFNWGPGYLKLIKAWQGGTWKQAFEWAGPDWKDINDPDTSSVGFLPGPALTGESKKKVDEFIKGLADGKINPFLEVDPVAEAELHSTVNEADVILQEIEFLRQRPVDPVRLHDIGPHQSRQRKKVPVGRG